MTKLMHLCSHEEGTEINSGPNESSHDDSSRHTYNTLCHRLLQKWNFLVLSLRNAKEATNLQTTLQELGHLHPPTPIVSDNSTAFKIANSACKQRRSRATMDMRYYWLQDHVQQNQFKILRQKAWTNLADYHSKHHSAKHHQWMRLIYLHAKQ